MKTKYSFWIGLRKTGVNILIVAAPLLIQILPTDISNLTLSGLILLGVNYLKVRFLA